MPICNTCAHNIVGYCPVWQEFIPFDKEITEHNCEHWRIGRAQDVVKIITGFITAHPEHCEQWESMRDLTEGGVLSARQKAAAMQVLWTAPYLDMPTRALLARSVVPY